MSEKIYKRIRELYKEICSELIKKAARSEGDESSWTRQRIMPLSDILTCILGHGNQFSKTGVYDRNKGWEGRQ